MSSGYGSRLIKQRLKRFKCAVQTVVILRSLFRLRKSCIATDGGLESCACQEVAP